MWCTCFLVTKIKGWINGIGVSFMSHIYDHSEKGKAKT